ncbi:hypothetical protein PT285_00935 [Lactobacillus sp. ESL0791]|uniref:hypothetical protein n=1 Tax=Lactobacillus sp. ESL0791 TaxID=2983234 RepID=UPI0023F9C04B|nr:hypothetical protein [Lactobacillus sp. ESL0791]MDF7638003.1 hypothetical protein [Lactobacillus sp. ESL0791]
MKKFYIIGAIFAAAILNTAAPFNTKQVFAAGHSAVTPKKKANRSKRFFDPQHPDINKSAADINTKINSSVSKLFPNTNKNKQVQLAADLYSEKPYYDGITDNGNKTYTYTEPDLLGASNDQNIIKLVNDQKYSGKAKQLLNFEKKQITKELAKQGKKFTDFSNYQIGSYVVPKTNKKNYGKAVIYLLPPKATLPDQQFVYFDPVQTKLFYCISSSAVNTELNNDVTRLFPKTIKNKQVQLATNLEFGNSSYTTGNNNDEDDEGHLDIINDLLGIKKPNDKNLVEIFASDFYKGDIKTDSTKSELFNSIQQALTKELAKKHKSFTDFNNYKIGASVTLDPDSNRFYLYMYLVSPKKKLPKISKYTFSVDDVPIN